MNLSEPLTLPKSIQNGDKVQRIIAVAGASSSVGKTTLVCDLIRELSVVEQVEAIKLSRGHYRSCGKDPHACCVSGLLGEQPTIRSGFRDTYVPDKDTARFRDAGASNVHWVIVSNDQVEQGIKQALDLVQTKLVIIEGTSILKYIKPDFSVLVVDRGMKDLKPTARKALLDGKIDALYLTGEGGANPALKFDLPVYTRQMIVDLFL